MSIKLPVIDRPPSMVWRHRGTETRYVVRAVLCFVFGQRQSLENRAYITKATAFSQTYQIDVACPPISPVEMIPEVVGNFNPFGVPSPFSVQHKQQLSFLVRYGHDYSIKGQSG